VIGQMQDFTTLRPAYLAGLGLLGLALCAGAVMSWAAQETALPVLAAGVSCVLLASLLFAGRSARNLATRWNARAVATVLAAETDTCLLVRAGTGAILWRNPAADRLPAGDNLEHVLADFVAQPKIFLRRHHDHAQERGQGTARLVLGDRPCVATITATMTGDVLWRICDDPDAAPPLPDPLVLEWVRVNG
jgi:hypothetical protein